MDEYLDLGIGAYGDDDRQRPRLVAVAQRRAAGRHGVRFGRDNTVVVGDGTHDVSAAIEGGASIAAVASGSDDEDTLRRAGAEVVLPDLGDQDRVLDAIFREGSPTAVTSSGAATSVALPTLSSTPHAC